MEIYEVGGAVRDRLLGVETRDRDWVVVGASEDDLLARGFRRVGADFPVFLHPQTNEEYALARTERKTGRGYRGFAVDASPSVTLEEDLSRRDFTINAMAVAADGTLVDPFGGRDDLQRGVLRHVTAAFIEDPLRVLRAARFAARFGFDIAPETLELMRRIVAAGELDSLAAERVWNELHRALGERRPERFVEVLRACSALAALFPEIARLFGVPQPARHHPEIDTGEHVLLALRQAARREANDVVRFAVLVHDLGKGATPAELLPSHRGHEESGVDLIDRFCARLRVPRDYRDLAVLVSRFHTRVHRADDMKIAALARLLEEVDAFRRDRRFADFLEACTIDATGRKGFQDRPYPQAERLRRAREVAAAVDTAPLRAQGLAGRALAQALHEARIAAITSSGI